LYRLSSSLVSAFCSARFFVFSFLSHKKTKFCSSGKIDFEIFLFDYTHISNEFFGVDCQIGGQDQFSFDYFVHCSFTIFCCKGWLNRIYRPVDKRKISFRENSQRLSTCRTSMHRTTTYVKNKSNVISRIHAQTNQSTALPWPLRVNISGAIYSIVPQNVFVCPPS
jgi:hypothetical protein